MLDEISTVVMSLYISRELFLPVRLNWLTDAHYVRQEFQSI